MAFSKKKADARKDWLHAFVPGTFLDCSTSQFTIGDFVQKELILFSMADNVRSIPSMIDGLKPGLRKILFACFKRRLVKQEIKVAQLAGYVSEHAAYHHGEASLCASIVGLAQDFTGSNNVSLLIPSGQFGTRLQGGKDAASPRYIFTCLSDVTRMLFMDADDPLLTYLNDDGQLIEPEWYMPIIPMVLVNGSEGIGTGWSTFIPPFSPTEIIEHVLFKISSRDNVSNQIEPMHPWFRNFTGYIVPVSNRGADISNSSYKLYGRAALKRNNSSDWILYITELPIGTWTQTYKEFLESLTEKTPPLIKGFTEHHTDTRVSFIIQLGEGAQDAILATMEGIFNDDNIELVPPRNSGSESFLKLFKLVSSISLTNMVAFDQNGHLKRYTSAMEILDEWFIVRLDGYCRRKEYLISFLTIEWKRLDAKVRFIMQVLEEKIIIARRLKSELISELKEKGFEEDSNNNGGYDYLLGMPLWFLTAEKIIQLEAERKGKELELQTLLAKAPCDLWKEDLMVLKKILSDPEYSTGVGAAINNDINEYNRSDCTSLVSFKQEEETVAIKKEKKGTNLLTSKGKSESNAESLVKKPINRNSAPTTINSETITKKSVTAKTITKRLKVEDPDITQNPMKPINFDSKHQNTIPFTKSESLLDRIQSMLSASSSAALITPKISGSNTSDSFNNIKYLSVATSAPQALQPLTASKVNNAPKSITSNFAIPSSTKSNTIKTIKNIPATKTIISKTIAKKTTKSYLKRNSEKSDSDSHENTSLSPIVGSKQPNRLRTTRKMVILEDDGDEDDESGGSTFTSDNDDIFNEED